MIKLYYGDISHLVPPWESYLVGKERLERTMGYKRQEDQARSIGAELILNKALARLFPAFRPPAQFQKEEHGKLFLAEGNEDLRLEDGRMAEFNLSHSGNFVACAVADRPVGVDIEEPKDSIRPGILRFLAEEEKKDVLEAASESRRFFEYWVLKESYMKAVGTGFTKAPSSFRVMEKDGRYQVIENGERMPYGFRLYRLPSGFFMAVCAENGIWEELEPEELEIP